MPTVKELEQKVEKMKRQAAVLETKLSKQKRSEDARRKILIGASAISLCETNEPFKNALYAFLETHVKRSHDREFLGLSKRESDT